MQEIADDSDDGASGNTTASGDTSIVTLADFEDPLEGPIIDDPVTGAGNEDLYLVDEEEDARDEEDTDENGE